MIRWKPEKFIILGIIFVTQRVKGHLKDSKWAFIMKIIDLKSKIFCSWCYVYTTPVNTTSKWRHYLTLPSTTNLWSLPDLRHLFWFVMNLPQFLEFTRFVIHLHKLVTWHKPPRFVVNLVSICNDKVSLDF